MPFPVDEKFIEAAEEKLGVEFPESFHAGMRGMNGGEIETGNESWRLFPVYDSSDKKRIRRTTADIARETERAKQWIGFPEAAVAIGTDDSGNYLIMLPEGPGEPRLQDTVYAWDHETGKLRIASPTVEILMNSRR